jgi:opacity protein-like surface antigen
MKNLRDIIFSCILGLSLLSLNSYSQGVNCSDNYEKALQFYNYGMADSALSILNPCLEHTKVLKGLSNQICADIFRLAALSSIMTGNPEEADEYIAQLLKYQPDYKNNIREDDLEEFKLILNSKSAQPDLILGVSAGINIPFLKLENQYSDYEAQESYYDLEGNLGFQFAVAAEKTLTKNISLEVAAGYTKFLFKYHTRSMSIGETQYDQSLSYIEIPVLARYYFSTNGHLKPYLEGGLSGKFSIYVREKSEDYGRYWLTESTESDSKMILASFMTDIENIGLAVGGGLSYNLKNSSLKLDVRYIHNFKSSGRISKFDDISGYEDIPEGEDFSYTNDINLIHLKNAQISLGYYYNLKYRVF